MLKSLGQNEEENMKNVTLTGILKGREIRRAAGLNGWLNCNEQRFFNLTKEWNQ